MIKNNLNSRFFVVIHAQHRINDDYALAHAIASAKTAHDNNVSGIFLIPDYENESNGYSKRATMEDLFFYYSEIKNLFPDFPVGVNFLKKIENMDLSVVERVKKENFNMIQSDGSFANVLSFKQMTETEFFTGLAFKYSKYESATGEDLKRLCGDIPAELNVIPTTSGSATGVSANLEKIKEIRGYLPSDKRLGIASGITLDNVSSFLEAGVTDFLVATSLIKENKNGCDILDGVKIEELAKKILK